MKRRFYAADIPEAGAETQLDQLESHHLRKVIRVREGEEVQLLDGQGGLARARVVELPKRDPVRLLIEAREQVPAPDKGVDVYFGLPKSKVIPQILRQLTELGVRHIYPLLTTYSENRTTAIATSWEQALREAVKQSGNPWLPGLHEPREFADALENLECAGYYGAIPKGESTAVQPLESQACSLWIGPEGGFSEPEIQAMEAKGLQAIAVGRHVLRVETALVVPGTPAE